MEVPKKIYICLSDLVTDIDYDYEWYGYPFRDSIEYTRTDTFIDVACEWMSTHLPMQYDSLSDYTKDFRKAMKEMKGE